MSLKHHLTLLIRKIYFLPERQMLVSQEEGLLPCSPAFPSTPEISINSIKLEFKNSLLMIFLEYDKNKFVCNKPPYFLPKNQLHSLCYLIKNFLIFCNCSTDSVSIAESDVGDICP